MPALLYYAVCVSMEHSFWETFKMMQKYTANFDDCWLQTLRVKRGIVDTSKPGAFCKDQATFDGSMRILELRDQIDFLALYAGKVSLETYFLCEDVLKELSVQDDYIVPPHIASHQRLAYFKKRVDEIYRSHQELFVRTNNIPVSK